MSLWGCRGVRTVCRGVQPGRNRGVVQAARRAAHGGGIQDHARLIAQTEHVVEFAVPVQLALGPLHPVSNWMGTQAWCGCGYREVNGCHSVLLGARVPTTHLVYPLTWGMMGNASAMYSTDDSDRRCFGGAGREPFQVGREQGTYLRGIRSARGSWA